MARSFPLEEGGSAIGVLITDMSHEPGCDTGSMRLLHASEQSTSAHSAKFNLLFAIAIKTGLGSYFTFNSALDQMAAGHWASRVPFNLTRY